MGKAAEIANKALTAVLAACVDGADIYELCKLGDSTIEEETGKVYNKKVKKGGEDDKKAADQGQKISKGIGFPTCVSVNEVAGNFSPMKAESKQWDGADIYE